MPNYVAELLRNNLISCEMFLQVFSLVFSISVVSSLVASPNIYFLFLVFEQEKQQL